MGATSCRQRVTEHNVLVVAKYYSRIRSERLAQLLDLPPPAAEEALSAMVVSGAVSAKIDRPAGADPPSHLWARPVTVLLFMLTHFTAYHRADVLIGQPSFISFPHVWLLFCPREVCRGDADKPCDACRRNKVCAYPQC